MNDNDAKLLAAVDKAIEHARAMDPLEVFAQMVAWGIIHPDGRPTGNVAGTDEPPTLLPSLP